MTCIIGLVENGNVYLGGDSAGVGGLAITIRKDEKVFVNGPFIIGGTTSFRMLQLLRYKLDPPKQTTNCTDDMKYMVTDFIDAVRKTFSDNGFGKMTEKESNIGGDFLVGYNGNLYTIFSDFQVGIPTEAFDAVGCGEDLAKGAMFASKGKKPEERIKLALKAASTFSAGVSPPFVIVKQIKNKII